MRGLVMTLSLMPNSPTPPLWTGSLLLRRCLRLGKGFLSLFSELIRGSLFVIAPRRERRLLQDGCKDGLGLINDSQTSLNRAEAFLLSVVLYVLVVATKVLGVFACYFA